MAAENVFGPTRTNRSFAVDSEILWMEGYWVRTSVNVDLTKEEKVRIGRPSPPRWELDIVGYSGRDRGDGCNSR